jgi:putative membrane protein
VVHHRHPRDGNSDSRAQDVPVTTAIVAHGLHPNGRGLLAEAVRNWTWEPVTIGLVLLSAVLYALGLLQLWRRAGVDRGIRVWEAAAFAAGLLSIGAALLSPLAWLSTILFSAHMTQHEILMLVSAPMLVFGRPLQAFLWAFRPARREQIARLTQRSSIAATWHALTDPAAVFLLHAAALWIWHIPPLYDAAIANEAVHAGQHASFLITAALFWWGMVHGRYGRISYGVGVLYVFLTALHSSVLGALLTVAPNVWYPPYVRTGAEWRVDALQDQQLAGLLMWVPSGVIFIVFGLALLAAWLGESERRARLGSVPQP